MSHFSRILKLPTLAANRIGESVMSWAYPTEESDEERCDEEIDTDSIEEIDNTTSEPTSADELVESYLKKILLKAVLDEEFDVLSKHPSLETIQDKTILFAFLHRRFLTEFPPFKDRLDIQHKLEQILVCYGYNVMVDTFKEEYPKFTTVSRTATKKKVGGFHKLANIFDIILRTPAEARRASYEIPPQGTLPRRESVYAFYSILKQNQGEHGDINREVG
jgi:hypothetical protein